MPTNGHFFLIPLFIWASCADEPGNVPKMRISVKLEACDCSTKLIELSLIKNQPSGSCRMWEVQGDGSKSLNLEAVPTGAGESYQVALAAYCDDETSGSNSTAAKGSNECCADLAACSQETCSESIGWCEQCSGAAQKCEQGFSDQQLNIQELQDVCKNTGDFSECCQAIGVCMQAAWINCTSSMCLSCTEAMAKCRESNQEFDPARMSSQDLLRIILESCANPDASGSASSCCNQSTQCIQASLPTCQNIEPCASCQQASSSCGEDLLTAVPTPEAARGLYQKLCSEDPLIPTTDCVACYALEPLEIVAGETTLVSQASTECKPPEITQIKELPTCTAQ